MNERTTQNSGNVIPCKYDFTIHTGRRNHSKVYSLDRATHRMSIVDLHFLGELTTHTDFVAKFQFLMSKKGFDAKSDVIGYNTSL